jgi:hypothetical protein
MTPDREGEGAIPLCYEHQSSIFFEYPPVYFLILTFQQNDKVYNVTKYYISKLMRFQEKN